MDNIKTWAGLSVEESVRMTEDRDKWRNYVRGVANLRIEDGSRTGTGTWVGRYQNSAVHVSQNGLNFLNQFLDTSSDV